MFVLPSHTSAVFASQQIQMSVYDKGFPWRTLLSKIISNYLNMITPAKGLILVLGPIYAYNFRLTKLHRTPVFFQTATQKMWPHSSPTDVKGRVTANKYKIALSDHLYSTV